MKRRALLVCSHDGDKDCFETVDLLHDALHETQTNS